MLEFDAEDSSSDSECHEDGNSSINNTPNTHLNTSTNVIDEVLVEEELQVTNTQKCANCHRRQMNNITSPFYQISFHQVNSNVINSQRPFCFLRSTRSSTHSIIYDLCSQCNTHLTEKDTSKAKENKSIWPAMYWKLLQYPEIRKYYNAEYIWSFILLKWRE